MVPEMIDESGGADGKASRSTYRFAECPDAQRHPLFHAEQFTGASAGFSQDARCMRLVDKHHRIVDVRKVTKCIERGEDTVHAEQSIGDDQSSWGRRSLCELISEVV